MPVSMSTTLDAIANQFKAHHQKTDPMRDGKPVVKVKLVHHLSAVNTAWALPGFEAAGCSARTHRVNPQRFKPTGQINRGDDGRFPECTEFAAMYEEDLPLVMRKLISPKRIEMRKAAEALYERELEKFAIAEFGLNYAQTDAERTDILTRARNKIGDSVEQYLQRMLGGESGGNLDSVEVVEVLARTPTEEERIAAEDERVGRVVARAVGSMMDPVVNVLTKLVERMERLEQGKPKRGE